MLFGNYTLAEEYLKKSMEIFKTQMGEETPNVAIQLERLSKLYEVMGNLDTAEEHAQRYFIIYYLQC
jgi:hypothetical protein